MQRWLELDVVRDVAKLIERRWGLRMYVAQSSDPRPPTGSTLCAAVQSTEKGLPACRNHFALLTDEAEETSACTTCHVGLSAVAQHIDRNSYLVCNGFLGDGGNRAAVQKRATELGVDAERAKSDELTSLSRADEQFLSSLLCEAAAAIREANPTADDHRTGMSGIVGAAPAMQQLYWTLERVAPTDSTVLIRGDNGTGKELVARAIHGYSTRSNQPFVVVNCSAFNDNLLDSELFGHRRGAFTGAVSDKIGLFETADGGTLFLDEIGDMSPALQVKVLRVLQEGTFTPVGDTKERHVDVRVLSATNRNLTEMVASSQFREDLYYRINVIEIVLPPLRERAGDIPLLARAFLRHQAPAGERPKELAAAALDQLCGYAWPGNVRELQNEIERAVVLSGQRDVIESEDLSERIRKATPQKEAGEERLDDLPLAVAMRKLERRMIRAALVRHDWNKTRAAAELEISRRNLIRLVHKHELEKSD